VSRGSVVGEDNVFCLFEGGGRAEVDGLKFDNVGFCGVGVFGVEGRDRDPGEELPIEFLLACIEAGNRLFYLQCRTIWLLYVSRS
jgi:hypothetical protein